MSENRPAENPVPTHLQEGDFAGAFALLAEMTQDFAQTLDITSTLERALE